MNLAQLILVVLGGVCLSVGVALVYPPAGLMVVGVGLGLYGFYLVDDGEDVVESRSARPKRSTR